MSDLQRLPDRVRRRKVVKYGLACLTGAWVAPPLDPLRDDSRYREVLERVGLDRYFD